RRSLAWLRPAAVLGVLFGGIATAGATWGVVQLVSKDVQPPLALPSVLPPSSATPAERRPSSEVPQAADAPALLLTPPVQPKEKRDTAETPKPRHSAGRPATHQKSLVTSG